MADIRLHLLLYLKWIEFQSSILQQRTIDRMPIQRNPYYTRYVLIILS